MILWILVALVLATDGSLDALPMKNFDQFEACRIAAEEMRVELLRNHPPEVPAETQFLCWPESKESVKPGIKLMNGV